MPTIGGIHSIHAAQMDSLHGLVSNMMWRICHILKRWAAKVSNSTGGRHDETNSCEEDASRPPS